MVVGALPVAPSALDVSGRIGVGYSRLELTPPEGPRMTRPHLDVDLGLDARGVIVRREVFDWKLGGSYRRISDSVNGTETSRQEYLLYDASAALFASPRSAASLRVNASRIQSDFSTSTALDVFGQSVTESAGRDDHASPGA
jgi:hypothetical protein